MPGPTSALRVLVTGASGFLGGHVVRELAGHGHAAVASGRDEDALRALGAAADGIVVSDLAGLPGHRTPVDAVVHCAALSTPWARRRDVHAANVAGTRHALDFAARNGARRFVFVSSPSVYAARKDRLGVREDEVDVRRPLNGYIRSKLAAEALVAQALADGRIAEAVIVRPRGLIGVGDPSLVPRLLEVHARLGVPLFGDGDHLIDVTAVENAALGLRLALTRGDPRAGTYNLTNGEPRPFRALLDQLLDACGLPARHRRLPRGPAWAAASGLEAVCGVLPGRPEPPLTRYTLTTIAHAQTLDISRARADLGYAPRVSLDDALARIGAAHRSGRTHA
ncbi:NAD(P)-dependent oxidoreductase [Propioniciclava coleopterorum]|uniref:NAD(P)-dependent oxidoreductase n=1 Tax=Propioniciclava coleopterorum TaxID=2714937 RepID=A0A6G7Y5J1_9ACTN|nr:NAD(P)-dependent oxidoreductase [Propioniciclava coleopterorum]QIK71908.1 NAD(P)-dependent oxidoreductase [Propioniciclava coleopterorum]